MVYSLYVRELRYRLCYVIFGCIICFLISYTYAAELFYLLSKPYSALWGSGTFLLINVFEVLFGYIKIGLVVTGLYGVTLLGVHGYLFMLAGLHRSEAKRFFKWAIVFLIQLFMSLYFVYRGVLPVVYRYMLEVSDVGVNGEGLFEVEPRMMGFIELNLKIMVVFSLLMMVPGLLYYFWGSVSKDNAKVLEYRVWFYVMLLVVVISVLPPDMLIHFVVFGSIAAVIEVLVFISFVYRSYRSKLLGS